MLDLSFQNIDETKKTRIHRMNPSLKMICFSFLLIMVFIPLGFFNYFSLLIITSVLWIVAKMPRKKMFSILKSVILLIIIVFTINWIAYKIPPFAFDITAKHNILGWDLNKLLSLNWIHEINAHPGHYWTLGDLWGGHVSFNDLTTIKPHGKYAELGTIDGITYYLPYSINWYTLSPQVVIVTLSITTRIYLTIVIMTLLINTISSIELTFAIQDILRIFKIFKLPVNEWAMTISIAIRFVPNLLNESQRIMNAQASRGIDFKNGHLISKIKSIVSLVVPMFSIAFKKADELAYAMEARGYNPKNNRTRYRNYRTYWYDWIFFFFVSILLCLVIIFISKNILFAPLLFIDCFLL